MQKSKLFGLGVILATVGLLGGCLGSDGDDDSGTLSLGITDAPVDDASAVFVQFSGVEVHGSGETLTVDIDPPRQIDLLGLAGGGAELLVEDLSLGAGRYQWIRLKVDTEGELDSYIVTATGSHELEIPSGAESGLKLVRGFTIPAGGSAHFTIDFDLRKSVTASADGTRYTLRPALRLIDNAEAGVVRGNVDLAALGCDTSGNAVYIFAGHGAALNDINTTAGDGPLATANVVLDEETTTYHYRAAFLAPGDYTVALTCAAESDSADTEEADLPFVARYDVTVVAEQSVVQDF